MGYRNDMHLCEITWNPVKLYATAENYGNPFSKLNTLHFIQNTVTSYYSEIRKGIKYMS